MRETSRVAAVVTAIGVVGVFALGFGLGYVFHTPPEFSRVSGLEQKLSGAPSDIVQSSTTSIPVDGEECIDDKGERVPCDLVRDGISKATGKPADFSEFWRAWNAINDEYVNPTVATNQEKVWGAIAGLAASLNDPYTYFLPPKEAKIFQEDVRGDFGGVGMQVGDRNGHITVLKPLPGSPSERAGILKGDILIKIDDATTTGMGVDKAVYLIRGEIGSHVRLTIVREGEEEPRVFTVTREVIQVPTIELKDREDGVFVISLYGFPSSGSALFRDALRKFILTDKDKLVIDVRGNPGGYLEVAQDMASWFLPTGKVIVSEETRDGSGETFRSHGYNVFNKKLKLVVLVDEGTASAAEILSGALREHGIAVLVGKRTFGKGSVQKLVPITDDTTLKLTIAHWLLPSGKRLSKVGTESGGIEPDVVAEITKEDVEKDKDPQLDKAIEVLNNWGEYSKVLSK